MSPIPPKDQNDKHQPLNDQHEINDQIDNPEQEFEIIDGDENPDEEPNSTGGRYMNIADANSNVNDNNNGEDDDDEDEDESESEPELDPEEHFQLLAQSRASDQTKPNTNSSSGHKYAYEFETDVFQRKYELEPEDIQLDTEKSNVINNLMSNFKLPETSVPEWAKVIPENVWKKTLIDSLNAKKIDLFNNDAPKTN